MALALYFSWDIYLLDITTAFLNASLDTKVYIKLPKRTDEIIDRFLALKGLKHKDIGDKKIVLHLLKSLYGLKQSLYEWNTNINGKLIELGFCKCEADENLYILMFENGCFLLLYVDVLLVGPLKGIENVKQMIFLLYKIRDLELAILFLDVEIDRWPDR
jgi:hypothetical protein